MFDHLAHEVHYVSFLFVGFSLSDPNFNLIRDDARLEMGDNMPASYLAQERPDPVVRLPRLPRGSHDRARELERDAAPAKRNHPGVGRPVPRHYQEARQF
jgi:hypothetical protein